MAAPRPGRVGPDRPPRTVRSARTHRAVVRPVRIAMPTEGDTTLSRDRVLLLRFDWPTSGDETQPVLLALPERLD